MKTIDTAANAQAKQAPPAISGARTAALTSQRFSAQMVRRLTGPLRLLPDFLIIGGQRCGTSSLYYYLTAQHGVVAASTKEIHFFDDFYTRGLNWYRAQFPTVVYKKYTENVCKYHFLTGEASPYYLFHPHAPRRIDQLIADAPGNT